MTRRRADHLRLVVSGGAPEIDAPAPRQLVDDLGLVDAGPAPRVVAPPNEWPQPGGFTIGALCRVEPWQLPTWRPFHGVAWFARPSLFDRLKAWFDG